MFMFLTESYFSNLIGTREKAIVFKTDVLALVGLDPVL